MMLNACEYPEAVNWLASAFGEGPVCEELAVVNRLQVARITKTLNPIDPAKMHGSSAGAWGKVRSYLVHQRGISETVIDRLHKIGKLWADRFENCVFPLSDPKTKADVGVYLRGTRDDPFHGIRGKKGVYMLPPLPGAVAAPDLGIPEMMAVVEAPIDAIAVQEMGFEGEAVATCGQPSREVSVWLQAISKIKSLFVGFDNDPAGDAMADGLGVGTRYKPQGKDWSEDLKSRLDSCAETSGADKQRARGPSGSSGSLAEGM
jgi:hypothetical protein